MAENDWAIVIGINHYRFLPTDDHLKYAVSDALKVRQFLCEEARFPQENVLLCCDSQLGISPHQHPNRADLRDLLKHGIQRARDAHNFWFFFAGHGIVHDHQDFLLPYDGNPRDLEQTAVPISFVIDCLRDCGVANVVLVMDMCRNRTRRGPDDGSRDISEEMGTQTRKLAKEQGIVTLFSCSRNERSYEIMDLKQGAFTYVLLEGLRQNTTPRALEQYLINQLPAINLKYGKPSQQPMVIPEPGWKYDRPLLLSCATPADIQQLRIEAMGAELEDQDNEKAKAIWWQVIEADRSTQADRATARKAIDRIAASVHQEHGGYSQQRSTNELISEECQLSDPVLDPKFEKNQQEQHNRKAIGKQGIDSKSPLELLSATTAFLDFPLDKMLPGLSRQQRRELIRSLGDAELEEMRRKGGFEWHVKEITKAASFFSENLDNDIALSMLKIPAGRLLMGSPTNEPERADEEGPQHEVFLGSFFLAQTPITQAQWRIVSLWEKVDRDLQPSPSKFNGPNRPVEQVSWLDVMEFCSRLNKRTGKTYCLPTEAQWEYACRAGTSTPFHFGTQLLPKLANYVDRLTDSDGNTFTNSDQTTDVGIFPANEWCLHDMHGNVWEWCQDHWHDSYIDEDIDEEAPVDGSAWIHLEVDGDEPRVIRGGAWSCFPEFCRSAARSNFPPDDACEFLGFRVCCLQSNE
jgi:formylglycine-generating enzyme required for sulfatase activity/uncharacterized caspase-like protein